LVHGNDLLRWQFDNLKIFGGHFQSYNSQELIKSKVVSTRTEKYNGHVYNFETVSNNYITQKTVVSNCRCTYELIIEGEDD
jgi:hypothetical protein